MKSTWTLLTTTALIVLLLASPAAAGKGKGHVAVKGYDVVAYFTKKSPTKGSAEHSHSWKGTTWHFASAQHLAMFKKSPEKFAPQYGGYCAWAVSQGYTAPVDPKAWKVVAGKLYLNYNADIQAKWEKDRANLIEKADANWPKLSKKSTRP